MFMFKNIDAFNIRQKNITINSSLCKTRVIILFVLVTKAQKINIIKLINMNSQSNTLFNNLK